MKELLEIYNKKGKLVKIQERKEFYSEIKKDFFNKKEITLLVKSVRLILLNSQGNIYLQKRSKLKEENPGRYDKTIGGHVSKGHSYELAMIKEASEELGFPAVVLSGKEFNEAVDSIDLNIIGILKKIDYIKNFNSTRITKDGDIFIQPFMATIYIGYYDGSIRFSDGESSGIEVFSLKELEDDIKNNPDKFTEDIKFMIKKYKKYIKPLKQ